MSGHDPTGGAGIQADVEILRKLQCHPVTLITALTAQNTLDVGHIYPQEPAQFLTQAHTLLADVSIAAIKIGLLASASLALAVRSIIDSLPPVPVILDPILAAGGGHPMAGTDLMEAMVSTLVPYSTVITPNTLEARRLSRKNQPDECAQFFLSRGCANVLLTGTHDDDVEVVNRWYSSVGVHETRWPRLPASYHGSGCTLASALAANLALGLSMNDAVMESQRLTWESLRDGYAIGGGQLVPRR